MSIQGLNPIRKALEKLNPKQVRESCERPFHINLHATDADAHAHAQMEAYLLQNLQPDRRRESAVLLSRGTSVIPAGASPHVQQIDIYYQGLPAPADGLIFRPGNPEEVASQAIKKLPDTGIALARYFQPFRRHFAQHVIQATCRENTLFSITTALPDVIPNFFELPWAVAEFASDSAFLTMNQVRMAFRLAGASDREIGFLEQKSEIAAVIGSAFGWRALARQLVGKIPFGGGLIAKAGVAYAGTKLVGVSLDRYYATGYTYTREERRHIYNDAYEHGKKLAQKIFAVLRPDLHRSGSKALSPASLPPGGTRQNSAASYR